MYKTHMANVTLGVGRLDFLQILGARISCLRELIHPSVKKLSGNYKSKKTRKQKVYKRELKKYSHL